MLGCSVAVTRLAATRAGMPLFRYLGGIQANRLPVLCIPLIRSGGCSISGGGGQLYLLVPRGASTFSQAVEWGSKVSYCLLQILKDSGLPVHPDADGAFILEECPESGIRECIVAAIQMSALRPGHDACLCLAPATVPEDILLSGGRREPGYPVTIPEDGLGYDLRGIQMMFISPCHMRTVTDCMDIVQRYNDQHRTVCLSCSGAQTDDAFMADLAMAARVEYIKIGLPPFARNMALMNRLLWIEEELGSFAGYAGIRIG